MGKRDVVAWIDFLNLGILINNFRFVIAHSVDLVCDLVEGRLAHHDADQFSPAEFHAIAIDFFCRAPLIGERIEGELRA